MIELENKPKQKGGISAFLLVLGLILFIVLIFLICGGLPLLFATNYWEDTRSIQGEGSAYDPIAEFAYVSEYAGENARLLSMDAYYVRSDGTLDLYADYFPRVTFEFYREVMPDGSNDIPLGAPNSNANADKLYQTVTIDVWHPNQMRSVSTTRSYSYMHLGMERDMDEPVRSKPAEPIPNPACSLADLWAIAIESADAPSDAVAMIQYNEEGYYFYINDTDIRLNFDFDCTLSRD